MFDSNEPGELQHIIDTQYKVIDFMKQNKMKKLYQIPIIIDDFADDPHFTRHSKLLRSLFNRGRHIGTSNITATQVYKAISSVIRKNITDLYMFKLRNHMDMEAWLDEVRAIKNKDILVQLYEMATD